MSISHSSSDCSAQTCDDRSNPSNIQPSINQKKKGLFNQLVKQSFIQKLQTCFIFELQR